MDMAKNAARAITQLLTSTADEIGLVQIGTSAKMLYGLSTNKAGFSSSVDAMSPSGGMNSGKGLFDIPYGALTHLQNARNGRALLLITDGASSFDVQNAISTARTYGISVYVLGLSSRDRLSPEWAQWEMDGLRSWISSVGKGVEKLPDERAGVGQSNFTVTRDWLGF